MLKIYNTLTRQKEEFKPLENKHVKMFVCGPTVYNLIHLGNARTFLFFDVVAKYLRAQDYDVFYVQNITNIDDKIIRDAQKRKISPEGLAKEFESHFYEDMKNLGINAVSKYARASEYIDEIIRQVKVLIEKKHAYKIEGDGWYFDLTTFPQYGILSGRTAVMAEDGVSRIDESSDKKNKGDFCLWKFSKPGEPTWDFETGDMLPEGKTTSGAGRPGWHIEDTAITEKLLGPQYDIHGGGQDLMFPHHEAEIAQQASASGIDAKDFVKYWMHAGFLVNKEQKMSKSLGNFMTLRETLNKYRPEVLRFYFLSSHYRGPLDYSEKTLTQSEAAVARLGEFLLNLKSVADGKTDKPDQEMLEQFIRSAEKSFYSAMDDDFAVPEAIGYIFELVKKINPLIKDKSLDKITADKILAFLEKINIVFGFIPAATDSIPDEITNLVENREKAREQKDFGLADNLREQIKSLGYKIDDTAYGPLVKKI